MMTKFLKKLPFYSKPWFQFLLFLIRHFIEDNCQQKAASLTYTTMLSIVPIITVVLVILSSVPALESVREQFQSMLYENLLPQSSIQVSQYINDFAEKSSNLTAIGVLVLFFTTIMTLLTIESAFNQIWRVEDKSGGLKSLLRYWTIVTLGPLLMGTALIVSGTIQSISFLNQNIAGYGIDWAIWVQLATFCVIMAGFVGMYWFVPKARVPFKNALIAGVITAVLFEALKQIFSIVMSNFTSYEAVYGAFAALPIFLLWVYLSWNLILLGVEISYTLTIFDTEEVYPRHPIFSLLDMLNLVYKNYQMGNTVSEQDLRNVLGRRELPKWYSYISYLKHSNLITLTDDDNYVLKKDLNTMTLWEFYKKLPFPLPIKDELDDMDMSSYDEWFEVVVERFRNTEILVKEQLNLPLVEMFQHIDVRKQTDDTQELQNQFATSQNSKINEAKYDNASEQTSTNNPPDIATPDMATETFNDQATKVKLEQKQDILIPDELDNEHTKQSNIHQKGKSKKSSWFTKITSKVAYYRHKLKDNLISEADKPQPSNDKDTPSSKD